MILSCSCKAISINLLYLHILSLLLNPPTWICPVPKATHKSEIYVSSVSQYLEAITAVQLAFLANKIPSIISLNVATSSNLITTLFVKCFSKPNLIK